MLIDFTELVRLFLTRQTFIIYNVIQQKTFKTLTYENQKIYFYLLRSYFF